MPPASLPPPLPRAESVPVTPASTESPAVAAVLSCVLVLFLASAVVSLLDLSFLGWFGRTDLSVFSGILFLLMLLTGLLIFGVMGLVPGIPKRLFMPVCLFIPVVYVGVLPLLVWFSGKAMAILWCVSLAQVLLGIFVISRLQGGFKFRWPLVPPSKLADRGFSWGNLAAVFAAGIFLIVPVLVAYTGLTAMAAVNHLSAGFVKLRPAGISMQVRKYVRDDGRKITLVPMSHVGEADFYQSLAASFPPDSVVLLEGVSDRENLADVHSDYSKMAATVGGVEQTKVFKPQGELVHADVDISTFSPETIKLLKTAMLLHAKGVTAETLPILMQPAAPGLEKQLLEDILTKRNHHLLGVIRERLPTSETIIVPWGAAHMPEIAREIEKDGFRVTETEEFMAIRFGS
ncbi:MAG: hypothetical protein ACRDBP_13270 [Luteolibacter sp.]